MTIVRVVQRAMTSGELLFSMEVTAATVADGFPVGSSDTTTIIKMRAAQSRKESIMKWGQWSEK